MPPVKAEPVETQLLRGRVALYIVVAVLVTVAADASTLQRLGSLVIAGLAAAYPLAATTRQRRLALAAASDVAASLVIWMLMGEPVISLLIVLWGLTITAFLEDRPARKWIVIAAGAGEVVKLPFVLVVMDSHRILGEATMATGTSDLLIQTGAKVLILMAAYQFLRLIGSVYVRAFDTLRDSAIEHSRLLEGAPTAVLVSKGTTVEYANAAACQLLGMRELGDIVGADLRQFVDPTDVDRLTSTVENPVGQPIQLEDLAVLPKVGPRRVVDAAFTEVTFAGAPRTQIAFNDVTFRSEAQFALAESEELFRGAFSDSATPYGIATLEGQILGINEALSALFGYSEADIVGKSWMDFMDPADRRRTAELVQGALNHDGAPLSFETRFSSKAGVSLPVQVNTSFITDQNGQPSTMFTQVIDRTARVSAEREVETRISQQQTIAYLGELALRNDVPTLMRETGEALSQHLGAFVTGVFLAQSDGTLILEAGIGWPADAVGAFEIPPGSSEQMDYVMTHHDAFIVESLTAEQRFAPSEYLTNVGAQGGISAQIRGGRAPLGVVGAWSDKERSYSEDDVHFVEAVANLVAAAVERHAAQQRLEELVTSKDQFLASVSHELRTPLTVVNGMAAELRERWNEFSPGEVVEFVRLIADQSRDMAALIEDLLVAARADIGAVTIRAVPVDIRRELESVLESLSDVYLAANDVRHVPVIGDATRLRQILRNLLTNADRYGGDQIRAASHFDGEHVTVTVSDNGTGIPPEMRSKIFEPYQRAHESSGVTGSVGLGLSVSRTLAELMGGSLTYRYENGESSFDLRLLAASTPAVSNVVRLDGRRRIGG